MHSHPYESNCITCGGDISGYGIINNPKTTTPLHYDCCSNECLVMNLISQMAEDRLEADTLADEHDKLYDKLDRAEAHLDHVQTHPWTNLLEYYKTKWVGKALALSLALLPLALAIHIAW